MHALKNSVVSDLHPVGQSQLGLSAGDTTTLVSAPTAEINIASISGSPVKVKETLPFTELYGSFFLGEDEFALQAIAIREVVNFPEKITPIPLSPDFLEGVFTVRGDVIPVLNLGRIFSPQAPKAASHHKIAIIDYQGINVGLLFHSTGEILRVRPEQLTALQYRDATTHGVISGTIRLDNGARVVQILDPATLISIENIPQIQALKSTGRKVEKDQFHLQADRRQCVAFRIGDIALAFEMDAIREIIDVPELKNSVLNSKLCVGRINLRGVAVAVVDFAQLLEVKSDQTSHEKSAEQRIIIARIGEASIGLLVDAVDNIFSYFPGDVLPVPLFSNVRSSMFGGCIQKEGVGTILYLNHEHIFSSTEIIDLTRGHTELYQQENAIKNTKVISGDTQRKVYITFSIGSFYALEIAKMREIIDCPTELVKPPRMPAFVEGVFSLRRRMVTILNLRCFYQMKQIDQVGSGKILIVERDNELFGLMVDAVENIVTVSNSDRIRAPRISDGKVSNDSHNEIHEVLQITRSDQENETINVFNIDSFFDSLTQEMEPAPV